MTKVVFHLGDRKTGSTAIQTTLASGSFSVKGVSLLYPVAYRLQHLMLAKSLSDAAFASNAEARFTEVNNEILEKKPDFAVISAEDFEDVEPKALKQAIEKYMPLFAESARFIAYVRPHAERTASSFAERSKIGVFSGTMAQMHSRALRGKHFIYMPRFQKWKDTFGPQFELRPMVRELLQQQNVVADLFTYVLGDHTFELHPMPFGNEAVSIENLVILRRFQKALRETGEKKGAIQNVMGGALSRRMNAATFRDGTKVQMHRALAEVVARDYAEDARQLDEAFFVGSPMTNALQAAASKALEDEQSVNFEDYFTGREAYLIDLFVGQLVDVVVKDPDYFAKIVREDYRSKFPVASKSPGDTNLVPSKTVSKTRNKAGRGKNGQENTNVS